MDNSPLVLFAAFAVPLLLNLVLTPFILYLSHKNQWFDHLDHRKVHAGEVPRLGGVGFFMSFGMVVLGAVLFIPDFVPQGEILFMLGGFLLVHLLGLIDDFRNIRARHKLVGQAIAGVLVVLGGAILPGFSFLGFQVSFGILSAPLTVFWLISLSNAINLIDGVDGLAGGSSLIAALYFGAIHLLTGSLQGAFVSFALAGALVGFLAYNRPKARIFMGDSGSLFLGFVLGSLFFIGVPTGSPLSYGGVGVSLTLLVVPVIDMVGAIIRRVRKGRPIFSPDREHIHHKLMDFGFSVPGILGIIYPWVILAGGAGLLWAFFLVDSSIPLWVSDLPLLVLWAFSILLFWVIHEKNKRNKKNRSPE